MRKYDDVCDCNVIHRDIVEEVKTAMPDKENLDGIVAKSKAISDRTRFQILWALDLHELCVCDLAVLLGMTKSAISHQLRMLKKAELVKYRKDGKIVFYSLSGGYAHEMLELSKKSGGIVRCGTARTEE